MSQPFQYSVVSDRTSTMYHAVGTTSAAGALTFTIPAGMFSSITAVHATAVRDTVSATTACFALVRSYTTSSVVVQVFESKTTGIALGGTAEGLEVTPTATSVCLTVFGY